MFCGWNGDSIKIKENNKKIINFMKEKNISYQDNFLDVFEDSYWKIRNIFMGI